MKLFKKLFCVKEKEKVVLVDDKYDYFKMGAYYVVHKNESPELFNLIKDILAKFSFIGNSIIIKILDINTDIKKVVFKCVINIGKSEAHVPKKEYSIDMDLIEGRPTQTFVFTDEHSVSIKPSFNVGDILKYIGEPTTLYTDPFKDNETIIEILDIKQNIFDKWFVQYKYIKECGQASETIESCESTRFIFNWRKI